MLDSLLTYALLSFVESESNSICWARGRGEGGGQADTNQNSRRFILFVHVHGTGVDRIVILLDSQTATSADLCEKKRHGCGEPCYYNLCLVDTLHINDNNNMKTLDAKFPFKITCYVINDN